MVIVPLVGIPRSHLLPPAMVWNAAQGKTTGLIVKYTNEATNNPFKIGDRIYYIRYEFKAVPPEELNAGAHVKRQLYQGRVRLTGDVGVKPGQTVPVRYELTYPEISGVDDPRAGIGCYGPSAWFSGWLIWLGVCLVLSYGIMLLIERFSHVEDF